MCKVLFILIRTVKFSGNYKFVYISYLQSIYSCAPLFATQFGQLCDSKRTLHCYSMSYKWRLGPRWQNVTLSPPTSEAGVPFPAQPQVGKLVVACRWSAVYSTEPWPTVCTGFLCPSNYPSWYDLYSVESDVKPQINNYKWRLVKQLVISFCSGVWSLRGCKFKSNI